MISSRVKEDEDAKVSVPGRGRSGGREGKGKRRGTISGDSSEVGAASGKGIGVERDMLRFAVVRERLRVD